MPGHPASAGTPGRRVGPRRGAARGGDRQLSLGLQTTESNNSATPAPNPANAFEYTNEHRRRGLKPGFIAGGEEPPHGQGTGRLQYQSVLYVCAATPEQKRPWLSAGSIRAHWGGGWVPFTVQEPTRLPGPIAALTKVRLHSVGCAARVHAHRRPPAGSPLGRHAPTPSLACLPDASTAMPCPLATAAHWLQPPRTPGSRPQAPNCWTRAPAPTPRRGSWPTEPGHPAASRPPHRKQVDMAAAAPRARLSPLSPTRLARTCPNPGRAAPSAPPARRDPYIPLAFRYTVSRRLPQPARPLCCAHAFWALPQHGQSRRAVSSPRLLAL